MSNEFPAFEVDPERLNARWLANYLRSPDRWLELASSSRGLGVRRQRVAVESVLAYEIWLPPIEEQRSMIRTLDRLEMATRARNSSDERVKALMPAALNQEFASLGR